ncbi:MAG: FAD-binding dehydrogenase [Gammaproteobacteria bacterium]|jgi:fumarate reductase flavoprotein subunit|nr:FAD-binding dehydrogenase [Gammaproteobacteria bacterium]|tara:strand:+ start:17580 stop:19007 length:1428 start_codon:yes stop_codon:yes gene_type:complete
MDRDYDVIVVGGGGAGMSAAIEAHDAGASVALIETDSRLGGSTALSGGVYYASGTSVQRAKGIEADTPDAMFEYYMTLNQYRVEPSLARVLSDKAAGGLEWLIEMGVEFTAENLYSSGVESVARGHGATGNGAAIAAALDQEVSKRNIDVALNARVQQLQIKRDNGAVTGVILDDAKIQAGAVVLTTGGFGANPNFLHRYYPEATAHGDWVWYIGNPNCLGDGLSLGEQAGAEIVGHNRGLLLTTPNFKKELEVYVPGWIVYVNREGRRFVNELAEYAVMSGVVNAQTGGSCFAIFDEVTRMEAKPDPLYADLFASGMVSPNWVSNVLEEQTRAGKIITADSLLQLAEKAGIKPGALQSTVDKYNADCDSGSDSMFFKTASEMKPVRTPPFYAVEIRPAIVCLTSTGVRIDKRAQAIDSNGMAIEGLFAAGETTGGVLGERYIGGGNSITNAIVFGRIAGESAAIQAQELDSSNS